LLKGVITRTFIAYAVLVLAGCGGGGGGSSGPSPTLTSISFMPNTAAAGITLTVAGSFSFNDSNGDLDGGTLNYRYGGATYSFPLPAAFAGQTSGSVMFSADVTLDQSTGSQQIPFWLVDRAGHSSNILQVMMTQLWTRQFGSAAEDIAEAIAIDSADNVLVAGTTTGSLDGETNPGGASVFVAKYAPGSARLWTRIFGSDSADTGNGLARDSNDNVYVVGDTQGTSFNGQAVQAPFSGFLTKLDTAGTIQWTRLLGTSGEVHAYAVATDAMNNVYVVGEVGGDLDGETHAEGADAFIVKFDSAGTRQWTRLFGTSGVDLAYAVTVGGDGNIYVAGIADNDVFVARYGPDGTLQWSTLLATRCGEWAKGIAVGGGGVYVAGAIHLCAFDGNTASGARDAFVAFLDASGTLQWVRQFGTSEFDMAKAVTTDAAGNAYVTGYLDSVYSIDDYEGHAIFVAKYDNSGQLLWRVEETSDNNWGSQGRGVAIDSHGNVFVTGMVHGQLDGHVNPAIGEDDAFVLKLDSAGIRR